MKILTAQLNPISGDVEYNKNKIIDCIKYARNNNADLVVFPKLFLLGNPFGDILEKFPYVLDEIHDAIDEIKSFCDSTAIILSTAQKVDASYKNVFYFIENKEVKFSFEEAIKEFNFKDKKIAILNTSDLSEIKTDADIIIYPDSSYSKAYSEYDKNLLLSKTAKKLGCELLYVNQAGAMVELVYDGLSRLYDKNGSIIALAKAFEEDRLIIESGLYGRIEKMPLGMDRPAKKEFSLDYSDDLERTYLASICAIKDYFYKNGFKRAVLGLSGGLDSSACATLCADALGKDNVIGISMPSKITSSNSKNDAKELANNLGIGFFEIPIKDIQDCMSKGFDKLFDEVSKKWDGKFETSYTQDNIQARSRATILWGVANEYDKAFTIATSDKSESYMGYATINGDMSGSFAPIADITKTKLFALCDWMNKNRIEKNAIPKSVLEKPPGAELAINPKTGKPLTAEEALMPYEFLDEVIWRIENLKQNIDDMMRDVFLFEKKNSLDKEQKLSWLKKFFRRMKIAGYKWYISAPSPVIDSHSINRTQYSQPITTNIKH